MNYFISLLGYLIILVVTLNILIFIYIGEIKRRLKDKIWMFSVVSFYIIGILLIDKL